MDAEAIRIEKVKVKDLVRFACETSTQTAPDAIVPLGKNRALAYSRNPCADETDVGLLVAYLGEQCIGYLGIMPGLLRIGDRCSKVHWLSTWFVPPEFRRTSVGAQLLLTALSLKYDLVVCNVSEEAERVYRGIRFQELGPLQYVVVDFQTYNLFTYALRFVRKACRLAGGRLDIPDRLFDLSEHLYRPAKKLCYRLVCNAQRGYLRQIRCEHIDEVEDRKDDPVENVTAAFYRDAAIINWMLRYRWTTDPEQAALSDLNYHFAEIREVFDYTPVNVFSIEGDYKGYVVFSFSRHKHDSVLKILDFNFAGSDDYQYIFSLALEYARMYDANRIEMSKNILRHLDVNPVQALLLRKRKRAYFCRPRARNSPLAEHLSQIQLDYCDGDTAFT